MLKKDKGPSTKEMLFTEILERRINQYLEMKHEDAMMFVLDILDELERNNIKIK